MKSLLKMNLLPMRKVTIKSNKPVDFDLQYQRNLKQLKNREKWKTYFANQFRLASISYGLIFCLIGIVLTTIEPFKACTKCENTIKILIESFFIFMYSVSIMWLLAMFLMITIAKQQEKIAIKHSTLGTRRHTLKEEDKVRGIKRNEKQPFLSRLISKKKNLINFNNNNNTNNNSSTSPNGGLNKRSSDDMGSIESETNVSMNMSTTDLSKFYFIHDYENGTGELYMRVGTAIFSICAMIDRCLSLIQMLETYFNNHSVVFDCNITFIVSIIAKSLSVTFIFMQSFFIFKYANIIINYGRNFAVIGLMHIICTNFCVFVRTVVHETVAEIRHQHHTSHGPSLASSVSDSVARLHRTHSGAHSNRVVGSFAKKVSKTVVSALNDTLLLANSSTGVNTVPPTAKSPLFRMKQLGCINTISFTGTLSVGIQEAQDKLAPYLYPCIIEYSLMCLTIFYVLWASIEQPHAKTALFNSHMHHHHHMHNQQHNYHHHHPSQHHSQQQQQQQQQSQQPRSSQSDSDTNANETNGDSSGCSGVLAMDSNVVITSLAGNSSSVVRHSHAHSHHHQQQQQQHHHHHHHYHAERRDVHQFTIDCAKSTTGLFVGIFVLLLTIISLISYFIYKDDKISVAIQISEITELILIFASIFVSFGIVIKLKFNKFEYKKHFEFDYDDILLIVGLAGIYLFGFYSIIALVDKGIHSNIEALSLSIQIVSIFESTLQSILIIEGLKMYTRNKRVKKIKPGRSLVTLLILIDMSLWLSETFSVKKYDMNRTQLDYYDIVFWSIVSTVASPLAIFFRFHSSVCLSNIWKNLYE